MAKDLEEENKKLRKMIKLLQDEDSGRSVELLNEENIELEKILSKHKDRIVQEETKKQIAQNRNEMLRVEQKLLKEMLITGDGDIELQTKKVKLLQEALKTQKEMATAVKDGDAAAKDLGKSLGAAMRVTRGGVVDVGKMAAGMGKAAKLAKGMATSIAGGNWKDFGKTMLNLVTSFASSGLISILQIWVDLATAVIKVSLAVEDTTRAMQQSTGMNRELADSISAGIPAVRKYTHEWKILGEAATALYRGFTDFTLINKSTARDLAENAAMLSRIGVSYDSFTGSIQMATKGMGVAAEDGSAMMRDLTAHAQNIGTDIGQLTSAFAASGSELTKFGGDGVNAFKRLSETSKITGIDIQRLLAITEKFDTFEGAAEQAGMLNAALGGNFVNAMDLMMETDPRARFDMIRDSITQTAGSFENMGYYQRIYMAKAAGLKDVGELALMMSGNYELLDENMGKNSDSYIDQAKKARKWQSVQEELKTMMHDMIKPMKQIMPMVIELMKWFKSKEGIETMEKLFQVVRDGIKWLAKPENMKSVIDTTASIARNLEWIAIAFAGIVIGGNLLKFGLFVKKLKDGRGAAEGIAKAGKAINAATKGKAASEVVIKGGSAAQRAAQAGAALRAKEAATAANQMKNMEALRSSADASAKASRAAAQAAAAAAARSKRIADVWKSVTKNANAALEGIKNGAKAIQNSGIITWLRTIGDGTSKLAKFGRASMTWLRGIGPLAGKLLVPVGLVLDAIWAFKGAWEGAGDGLDGLQAPLHATKTGFDWLSSSVAGFFEGLSEGWAWLGRLIRPDWLTELTGANEPLADVSNLESATTGRQLKQQLKIKAKLAEKGKLGISPDQWTGVRGERYKKRMMEKKMKEEGKSIGASLQSGVQDGASDLVPHSLSNFSKGIVEGIALADEPIYNAITAPFVRAETLIAQIQKNIVSQHQMMATTIAGATTTGLQESTFLSAAGNSGAQGATGTQGTQPVVVQIMMDGAVVREEMIGTIGSAAGFAAVTGYSRK